MFYDMKANAHGLPLDPFYACVVPRPIGWISTLSPEGVANLAPYSFYNAFSSHPHYVAFGSSSAKHSLSNIEATGEFVVNMVTFDLREQMNLTSTRRQGDEFALAGIAKAACQLVKAPRVAASPVAFECKHFQTVGLPDDTGIADNWLVIGRVVGIHLDEAFIREGRLDTAAMKPIARLGYAEYATIDETWKMRRPD